MRIVKLGFVTASGTFAAFFTPGERMRALRPYEIQLEGEAPELRPDLVEAYGQRCREALHSVLKRARPPLRSAHADQPYGYADHLGGCFHLGCRVVAAPNEAPAIYAYLQDPGAGAALGIAFNDATSRFVELSLPFPLFSGTTCSFRLLSEPQPE